MYVVVPFCVRVCVCRVVLRAFQASCLSCLAEALEQQGKAKLIVHGSYCLAAAMVLFVIKITIVAVLIVACIGILAWRAVAADFGHPVRDAAQCIGSGHVDRDAAQRVGKKSGAAAERHHRYDDDE